MNGKWIGPFSPKIFMEELMPISTTDSAKYEKKRKRISFSSRTNKDDKRERGLYDTFAKWVMKYNLSPRMPFFISADQKLKPTDLRPDAGLQRVTGDAKEFHYIPATHRYATRLQASRLRQTDSRTTDTQTPRSDPVITKKTFEWGLDTLVVEFKGNSSDDPFYTEVELRKQINDPNRDLNVLPSFEKPGERACMVRGQLAMYVREMFNFQQRIHLFQLLVTGRHARILYVDHSGVIVSERIDYEKNPAVLGEFFWRYNHMTDKARGSDSTAAAAEKNERKLFSEVIQKFLRNMKNPNHKQRVIPDAELTLDPAFPVYKITVREVRSEEVQDLDVGAAQKLGEEKTVTMDLLVQRPIFHAISPISRATRGYVAVETTGEKNVKSDQKKDPLFLKDTWRIDHKLLKAENEMYRLLEKHGIKHIPRLVCGGDVEDQGVVQKTVCASWVDKQTLPIWHASIRVHFHHRLVQRLAYPIESATESKELVTAFYNVFGVIEEAYDAPEKIVHRDISSGNVMIGEEVTEGEVGLLGDWDHANETTREAGYEHQKFRTGTWAFMSIAMLEDPSKPHELLDDLESVCWTLFYSALHRFKHSGLPNMKMFEHADREKNHDGTATGRILGGDLKRTLLSKFRKQIEFACTPLQDLLSWICKQLNNYYVALEELGAAEALAKRSPTKTNLSDLVEARQVYDKIHGSLSKPSTWRERFKEALDSKEWIPADALTERQYPEYTEEEDVQLFEYSSRRSEIPDGRVLVAQPLLETTTDQPESELESEEEFEPAHLSSDEDDGDDMDNDFPPFPEADRITDISNPTSSPSASLPHSHMPKSPLSGMQSSSSEDDEPPSPTPFQAPSAKRTREDFEGPVAGSSTRSSSKRSRTELMSSMPPPTVIPLSALRQGSSRLTTRKYQSGEEGLVVPELGSIASRLRSRDKGKSAVRSCDI
ncbi:hypothetical protein BDY19DRAFT_1091345 [Irpex rosettiformis]|uniref:Uncharacterized protein n=1 Tax=Irpex rosettiformis TaxID=378272 RepID=A0ACB8U0T5_9APHY|nr:hypothetical protein BDY19DRAFT_1091345 [Irpex rosettiformis]